MTDTDEEPGKISDRQSNVYFLRVNSTVPHEAFRNDARTKMPIGKRNKLMDTNCVHTNTDITIRNRECKEMEVLKKRLAETVMRSNMKTQSSKVITFEITKQLELVHQRELKEQTKNLALQLENLKLRALLDAKANLVDKLMKELTSVRKVVNHVAKDLTQASKSTEVTNKSDLVHGSFKKELVDSLLDDALKIGGITLDTTHSE